MGLPRKGQNIRPTDARASLATIGDGHNAIVGRRADNRILEEAAGAAEDGGVGEFGVPDPQDQLTDFGGVSGSMVGEAVFKGP